MLEKGKTEAASDFQIELSSPGRGGAAVTRARGGVGVARGGGGLFAYLASLSTVSTVSSNPVIPGEIICILIITPRIISLGGRVSSYNKTSFFSR